MREWYTTYRWKRRSKAQLFEHPLCVFCAAKGLVTIATVADHVVPHRGNWNLFRLGDLQSLCKHCHDSVKKYDEQPAAIRRGYRSDIGPDGWPLDPKHPAYQVK